jgi:hypothetical protein
MIKKFNEYSLNESISVTTHIVLMILFIKLNRLTPRKMAENLKSWLVDFSSFASAYGYPIDKDVLDYKIQTIIDKAFEKIDKVADREII